MNILEKIMGICDSHIQDCIRYGIHRDVTPSCPFWGPAGCMVTNHYLRNQPNKWKIQELERVVQMEESKHEME